MSTVTRAAGRPAQFGVDDILRVGRDLGMGGLTMKAVSAGLGVTSPALYRYVDGRRGLERLVGESILAELRVRDEPTHGTERHLLSFALQLRAFIHAHPGMARYLQVRFPRGAAGRRVIADRVEALARRGYTADAATIVSGAVASMAIALAASEETSVAAGEEDTGGYRRAGPRHSTRGERAGLSEVAPKRVGDREYVGLLLAGTIRGLLQVAPPGRPVAQVVADLAAAEAEL
ncbi:hypothetical protein [Micromonospora sp. WMMD1082]|uniref:TetR/AcrR family transcriptional regulator n=1 Tax=Micromonospora sp. WMMD1082 TaxID=3016104 RepID=UPI002416D851|nr:hypothetical protein [Micromonospora sp. WMMD1082]MDG4795594.1 hypothetical protein [Micromonospora sp. WMMD1082]